MWRCKREHREKTNGECNIWALRRRRLDVVRRGRRRRKKDREEERTLPDTAVGASACRCHPEPWGWALTRLLHSRPEDWPTPLLIHSTIPRLTTNTRTSNVSLVLPVRQCSGHVTILVPCRFSVATSTVPETAVPYANT